MIYYKIIPLGQGMEGVVLEFAIFAQKLSKIAPIVFLEGSWGRFYCIGATIRTL